MYREAVSDPYRRPGETSSILCEHFSAPGICNTITFASGWRKWGYSFCLAAVAVANWNILPLPGKYNVASGKGNLEIRAGKVARPMSIKFVDPNALALLSALIAIELSQGLDQDLQEQNVLGNFIIDVGQILLTMAAVKEARKVAAQEQAAEAKTMQQQNKATETKQSAETKQSGSEQSIVEEDELIGRDREIFERRIARLEEQVRQLSAIRDGKS